MLTGVMRAGSEKCYCLNNITLIFILGVKPPDGETYG